MIRKTSKQINFMEKNKPRKQWMIKIVINSVNKKKFGYENSKANPRGGII